jgi:hypothetical protein
MPKARLVRGSELPVNLMEEVLRAYIYRWTVENKRRATIAYSSIVGENGLPTIAPVTDAEWLKAHSFYITQDGRLARTPGHCEPYYEEERAT